MPELFHCRTLRLERERQERERARSQSATPQKQRSSNNALSPASGTFDRSLRDVILSATSPTPKRGNASAQHPDLGGGVSTRRGTHHEAPPPPAGEDTAAATRRLFDTSSDAAAFASSLDVPLSQLGPPAVDAQQTAVAGGDDPPPIFTSTGVFSASPQGPFGDGAGPATSSTPAPLTSTPGPVYRAPAPSPMGRSSPAPTSSSPPRHVLEALRLRPASPLLLPSAASPGTRSTGVGSRSAESLADATSIRSTGSKGGATATSALEEPTTIRVRAAVNESVRSFAYQTVAEADAIGGPRAGREDRVQARRALSHSAVSKFARGNLVRELRGGLVQQKSFAPPVRAVHPGLKDRDERMQRMRYRSGLTFVGYDANDGADGNGGSVCWPFAVSFAMPDHPVATGSDARGSLAGVVDMHVLLAQHLAANASSAGGGGSRTSLPPELEAAMDDVSGFSSGQRRSPSPPNGRDAPARHRNLPLRERAFVTLTGWVRPTTHTGLGSAAASLGRLGNASTKTALTPAAAFAMEQRRLAEEKRRAKLFEAQETLMADADGARRVRDEKLAKMRTRAALNGEIFVEPDDDVKALMLDASIDARHDDDFLKSVLARDPHGKQGFSSIEAKNAIVAVLSQKAAGDAKPLRDQAPVPPTIPPSFERYEGLEVVAVDDAVIAAFPDTTDSPNPRRQSAIQRRHRAAAPGSSKATCVAADVLASTPAFFSRTWATGIQELAGEVSASKHTGFVQAVIPNLNASWNATSTSRSSTVTKRVSLAAFLGGIPTAAGACSIEVCTAADAASPGTFRHSFSFVPA